MPDTHDAHDERGGNEADPYDWDPVYAATTIDRLQKQLAAATARAEKAKTEMVRLRRRDAVQTEAIRAAKNLADCWQQLAEAAGAAPDGRSATLRAEDGDVQ
jgi:hypothetical protein